MVHFKGWMMNILYWKIMPEEMKKEIKTTIIIIITNEIMLFVSIWYFIMISDRKLYSIALNKAIFSMENCWYFSYLSIKTYIAGTH